MIVKQLNPFNFPDEPQGSIARTKHQDVATAQGDWWLAMLRDPQWDGFAPALAGKIGDARWLLAQRVGQGTPKAFMVVLVFWLTLLFASFGLFAPPNLTSAKTLTVCALAVAGAVAMILELENGFKGVVHISPEPMRQVVTTLQAEVRNETVAQRFLQSYRSPFIAQNLFRLSVSRGQLR